MPDLTAYNWVELSPATPPSTRTGLGMVYKPDTQTILAFGGRGPSPFPRYQDTFEFDLATLEWTSLSPATTPSTREHPVMVWDTFGERVLMYGGGVGTTGAARKDLYEWTGTDWSVLDTNGPTAPGAIENIHHGVWDTLNDRLLVGMGWVQTGPTISENRIYEWTPGGGWVQLTPSPVMQINVASGSPDPDPRAITRQAAMWDPVAELMYVMGGEWTTDRSNSSTWSFDGTGYSEISGESGGTTPGTHRSDTQMAWATDRGFLFGGNEATVGTFGELPSNVNYWFDGTDWSSLSPTTTPPARRDHSMVWTGDTAVMFGGALSGGIRANDTWMFRAPAPLVEGVYAIRHTFGLGA